MPGFGLPLQAEQEIRQVLAKLARAARLSEDCGRSRWDFAVELDVLDQEGISHETLRWLIGKNLAEQGVEIEDQQDEGRIFESRSGFSFAPRSCFVITDTGLELMTGAEEFAALPPSRETKMTGTVPSWDCQRHELWLGETLVKRFKWRAANQETVLAAFEEEGWPARIDDPLPPLAETDPKRRLSDAIKCLNRKQQNPLIRFAGDGTGEGILWEIASTDDE